MRSNLCLFCNRYIIDFEFFAIELKVLAIYLEHPELFSDLK